MSHAIAKEADLLHVLARVPRPHVRQSLDGDLKIELLAILLKSKRLGHRLAIGERARGKDLPVAAFANLLLELVILLRQVRQQQICNEINIQ